MSVGRVGLYNKWSLGLAELSTNTKRQLEDTIYWAGNRYVEWFRKRKSRLIDYLTQNNASEKQWHLCIILAETVCQTLYVSVLLDGDAHGVHS